LASVSATALAADYDPPPPPVEDLRPASYDWSGPYVGAYAAAVSLDGHYDKIPDCGPGSPPGCGPVDPEMSGTGPAGGIMAGWNYDLGGAVVGIEADWGWGGMIAQNREPAELTRTDFDDIITLRARGGWAFDRTLVYVTGGAAWVNVNFRGDVGPVGAAFADQDNDWVSGFAVGGGIEHAFIDNLHGRLEYLFLGMSDADIRLEDPNGFGGDVDLHLDGIHMVRAALTYNFSW
jgi:outer membrane immunogenic protein